MSRLVQVLKPDEKRREHVESKLLVAAAFELARDLEISKLLVQADQLLDVRIVEKHRESECVIWLSRSADLPISDESKDVVLCLPETPLSRMGQMNLGLLLAVLNGHVLLDDSLLFLSGVAGSERLDTLLIVNPRRDFPWFQDHDIQKENGLVATRELARILEIALRLASEGREGAPIGTIFVLGEMEELSPYLRQLILNPFEGHPKRDRNIHDPELFETVREFAALDGAFVVSKRGVVESAGTYLAAPAKGKARLYAGLGARHAAAAGITAETDALAVVTSSSSGTVTVFRGGCAIFAFEKPPHPQAASRTIPAPAA
jgi:DNA integrity scanning protein DisA with diadenylate cyclase activity